MPQSERKRRVSFGWQQVMEAVFMMTNLFEDVEAPVYLEPF